MIVVWELCVSYPGGIDAVCSVSFTVERSENVALIGANGAGKSTILSVCADLLMPSGGMLRVCGLDMKKENLPALRRKIGVVFQNPDDQLFLPTVGEDVTFGLRNAGLDEQETETCVTEALRALGIEELCARLCHRLPGGEKRSAAIAGVLAMRPEAMLLDEPSSFLDPRARRQLLQTLSVLGQTKLIATHDLPMASAFCTRAVILHKGEIAYDGDVHAALGNEKLLVDCEL